MTPEFLLMLVAPLGALAIVGFLELKDRYEQRARDRKA